MAEEQKYRPLEVQPAPTNPLPLAGWALVIGSLITYAYLLAPLRLMDADWEFETMSAVVDNSLLALLGMALVFHGRAPALALQKLIAMRALLVLSMILGIFYLLIIPLAYSDSQRLEGRQDEQFKEAQYNQKMRQSKFEEGLKKITTIKDLQALGTMLKLAPSDAQSKELKLDEDFGALLKWTKTQVHASFNEQFAQVRNQHDLAISRVDSGSFRIMAGAGLAAICYFVLFSMNTGLFHRHIAEPLMPPREN
jgi:ABC-type multidrug transport system fused ATPase/permease subunit